MILYEAILPFIFDEYNVVEKGGFMFKFVGLLVFATMI